MNRFQVLRELVPIMRDHLVVCNLGAPSQELRELDDQPTNFYMLGTMGLCSSIALGLALAQDQPVVAIEGDGSILSNLASLATLANNPASNLILIVIDNGSYGSTGDQRSYSSGATSLADVAMACGCSKVIECGSEQAATELGAALSSGEMTVIIVKCAPGNVDVPVIDIEPVLIRERFMAEISRRNS